MNSFFACIFVENPLWFFFQCFSLCFRVYYWYELSISFLSCPYHRVSNTEFISSLDKDADRTLYCEMILLLSKSVYNAITKKLLINLCRPTDKTLHQLFQTVNPRSKVDGRLTYTCTPKAYLILPSLQQLSGSGTRCQTSK